MIKTITALLLFATCSANAQLTATNFNCNDCNSVNHDLFTELDAGKVIVLVWIMPCGACIGPALEAQTQVQNALATHAGKVKLYVVDDYANTSCLSMESWCEQNNVTIATLFSDESITMSDYGKDGMPKVVVLGGADHTVFYNKNDANIVEQEIGDAIAAAIAASPGTVSAVARENEKFTDRRLYPNPVQGSAAVKITLPADAPVTIEIMNARGQLVRKVLDKPLGKGDHSLNINMDDLAPGTYYLRVSAGNLIRTDKVILEK